VRRLMPDKEKYSLSADEQAQLERIVDAGVVLKALKDEKIIAPDALWKDIPFYKPKENGQTASGYSGRVGVHEVLSVSSAVKELIMKNAIADDIQKHARTEGMLTMAEDGIYKAAQGVTTIEEVLRAVTE